MFTQISKDWTLFLDRDGVINRRLVGQYVCKWSEFEFLPGVPEAIEFFKFFFGKIVIVTNQQGIGKGLMTEADLEQIHQQMQAIIGVDAIYHCPDLAADQAFCRKPNPGMAFQAQTDFPEIDFAKSLMVGDSASDMAFGALLGMKLILIETSPEEWDKLTVEVDFSFPGLPELAETLALAQGLSFEK